MQTSQSHLAFDFGILSADPSFAAEFAFPVYRHVNPSCKFQSNPICILIFLNRFPDVERYRVMLSASDYVHYVDVPFCISVERHKTIGRGEGG